MNKNILIIAGVVVLAAIAILIISYRPASQNPTDINVTTEGTGTNDASTSGTPVAPGTSTGSTGTTAGTTVSAKIGETIVISGVTGTVKELVEDSRCPQDVQCIQAGTVKVKVNFAYGVLNQDVVLTLGQPTTLYGHTATLLGVKPDKVSTTTIAKSDYIFTFSIK